MYVCVGVSTLTDYLGPTFVTRRHGYHVYVLVYRRFSVVLTTGAALGIWPAEIVANGARGCHVSMNAAVAFMNVQPWAR